MWTDLLAGNIGDALYGASLIPNLKVLYLANQTFTGTLPTNNIAWKALEEMDLSNNNIEARSSNTSFSPNSCLLEVRQKRPTRGSLAYGEDTRVCSFSLRVAENSRTVVQVGCTIDDNMRHRHSSED